MSLSTLVLSTFEQKCDCGFFVAVLQVFRAKERIDEEIIAMMKDNSKKTTDKRE